MDGEIHRLSKFLSFDTFVLVQTRTSGTVGVVSRVTDLVFIHELFTQYLLTYHGGGGGDEHTTVSYQLLLCVS